jgi:biopolymer transport protein ExbD
VDKPNPTLKSPALAIVIVLLTLSLLLNGGLTMGLFVSWAYPANLKTQFRESTQEREMNVVLPTAASSVPISALPRVVFINISKDETYLLDYKSIEFAQIHSKLKSLKKEEGKISVVIVANRQLHFGSAVAVMDLCNQLGIYDYRLQAEE